MIGRIKWFNHGKCYGIIIGEDGSEYHVHFSSIMPHGTGFKGLNPGEQVTFTPVASNFRNARPEAKKVMRSVQLPVLPDNLGTSVEPMDVVNLKVYADGRIYLPKREETDPRDYVSGSVRAIYVGSPGSIREKTRIAVELPDTDKDGITNLPVDFNGGILTRGDWENNFPRGAFVLVIKIGDNTCSVVAKKLSVRTQDFKHVTDRRDVGEWVVVEIPFSQELAIPEYAYEEELAAKIWGQIPEEFPGVPQANFTKFAKAIAHAIISSKNPS